MTIGIYCFHNKVNNKRYIGQSVNIERRYRDHLNRCYNNSCEYSYLHKAINKYGIENFDFSILEICSNIELNIKEQYWISYYNSVRPYGYNLTYGGDSPGESFIKYTPEQINLVKQLLITTNKTYEEIKKEANIQSIGLIADINNGKVHFQTDLEYPLREKKINKSALCPQCGGKKDPHSSLCQSCRIISERKNWQSRDTLKEEIRTMSFVDIGNLYGVSDNAIRKRCKAYDLPSRKKDIKLYSDEAWEKI